MKKKIRLQFAETVFELGKKNKKIVVFVGDISHGIMQPFAKKFPDRYYNIGICEPAMVNIAAGLSKSGLIPIVHTIAPFLIERSYEQIKLDFAYQKLPINLVSVGATFDYSKLGCSHHSYSDFALLSQFEKSNFVYPGSALEFDVLFKKIHKKNNINYFRITENTHNINLNKNEISFGKGILLSKGKNLTVVCTAGTLQASQEAVEILKKKKISIDLIYLHTLKPIDKNLILRSTKKTKKILVVEDFNYNGGLASNCLSILKNRNVKFANLSLNNFIHDYGSYKNLNFKSGLTVKNITKKINFLLKKK